ncbi:MAG: DUF2057 domain-containing protein [Deltaproteobacteria bacterium]|nr:DUF2057 domain-containing protein [Deltaproteobacteria bacterium]
MKTRHMMMIAVFLVGMLCWLQGCSEKKVYRLSEGEKNTAGLSFPNFIEIRGIDGEGVENFITRMIWEGQNEVRIPAGTHAVELRYNDIWDIDDDDHEKVTSRYILLEFNAQPHRTYKVAVDAPRDRESAHKLAAHFDPAIVDVRTGNTVSRFLQEE